MRIWAQSGGAARAAHNAPQQRSMRVIVAVLRIVAGLEPAVVVRDLAHRDVEGVRLVAARRDAGLGRAAPAPILR